jgi:hypothetical protein
LPCLKSFSALTVGESFSAFGIGFGASSVFCFVESLASSAAMRARVDSERRAGGYAPVLGWNGAVAIFICAGFWLLIGLSLRADRGDPFINIRPKTQKPHLLWQVRLSWCVLSIVGKTMKLGKSGNEVCPNVTHTENHAFANASVEHTAVDGNGTIVLMNSSEKWNRHGVG